MNSSRRSALRSLACPSPPRTASSSGLAPPSSPPRLYLPMQVKRSAACTAIRCGAVPPCLAVRRSRVSGWQPSPEPGVHACYAGCAEPCWVPVPCGGGMNLLLAVWSCASDRRCTRSLALFPLRTGAGRHADPSLLLCRIFFPVPFQKREKKREGGRRAHPRRRPRMLVDDIQCRRRPNDAILVSLRLLPSPSTPASSKEPQDTKETTNR